MLPWWVPFPLSFTHLFSVTHTHTIRRSHIHKRAGANIYTLPHGRNSCTFSRKYTCARTRTSRALTSPIAHRQTKTFTHVGQDSANPVTPRRFPGHAFYVVAEPISEHRQTCQLKSTRWISSPWQQAWKVRHRCLRSNFLPLPSALADRIPVQVQTKSMSSCISEARERERRWGGKEPAGLVSSNSKGERALMSLLRLLLLLPKRKNKKRMCCVCAVRLLMLLL